MAQESRYSKIFVKIWHSKDFRTLSEEGKMLFLYLLTSPHRNMGGFYYLPFPYVCFDVGLDEKRVIKAFEELTDKDMALYDYNTQVVLIKKWFCYNPIENENQAKGLNKQLAEIPKSKLFKPFVNCVKEYCKYIESILKGVDIPSENPSETLSKPYTKPGTGTGSGSETGSGTETETESKGTESVHTPTTKPEKIKYADFVSLTNDEYSSLVAKLGEDGAKRCIEILDNYKGATGKKYKSDYRAILNWVVNRYEEEQYKKQRDKPKSSNPFLELMKEEGMT